MKKKYERLRQLLLETGWLSHCQFMTFKKSRPEQFYFHSNGINLVKVNIE